MVRPSLLGIGILTLTGVLLLQPGAWAQQASGIAGVARDTSGAVLPGVTVEATSPALIEKVRTVVTDEQGRYNIVDLRPGTYVVTFGLVGFNTLKREGVELTSGFTATVNGDLQVGAIEETVTVSGQSPLVDTQSVAQQKVISSEVLASLPMSTRSTAGLVALTLGVTGVPDVGGSSGLYTTNNNRTTTFHGKNAPKVSYDGMNVNNVSGRAGSAVNYILNPNTVEETAIETGGISAESAVSGYRINMIPREGSNALKIETNGFYTNSHFQGDNLTDTLRARGLTTRPGVLKIYDANLIIGGAIVRDKLWFLSATRTAGNQNQVAGVYVNATQGAPCLCYTPDLSQPAHREEWTKSQSGRVTWQVSPRNKINVFGEIETFQLRGRGEFASPEAAQIYDVWPAGFTQATWTSPVTSKFLLEAGFSFMRDPWPGTFQESGFMAVKRTDISILENSTGLRYNSRSSYGDILDSDHYVERFSASYVTGSHNFKVGISIDQGFRRTKSTANQNIGYRFQNGVPNQLTLQTSNLVTDTMNPDLGIFAQDRWTFKRLTLSYGVRFDYFHGYVPAQHSDAQQYLPIARDFAEVDCVPCWKDINPRLGVSYDLFGNGRTALKVSTGRYVGASATEIAQDSNPLTTSVNSVNRQWTDTNRNLAPDCDLLNPVLNGECGPFSNVNFGKGNITSRFDDALLRGFGARDAFWDFSTEVQHELRPGVSVNAGYYRNWNSGYLRVAGDPAWWVFRNLAVTKEDFSPYCVTAPVDARLPNGGGYQVCGLYDISLSKFGQVDTLITNEGNGGKPKQSADFFAVSLNSRLGSRAMLGGGVDTGRRVMDISSLKDQPQFTVQAGGVSSFLSVPSLLLQGRLVTPFKAQTQMKAFGSFQFPGDFSVSGNFQSQSGPQIQANYAAPNSAIRPTLGRNLAACGAAVTCNQTVVIPLIPNQTMWEGRRNQLDLRLSKVVRLGQRVRLRGNFDIYNVLNASSVLALVNTYGPTWLLPAGDPQGTGSTSAILDARLIEVGWQLTF